MNKLPSNPATFEQERPGHEAVSTLHWPKNEILAFFKFLQKKVSWHDKIIFLHLLNESKGFATRFLKITSPKLCKKEQELFCQAVKLEFEKCQNVSFWPM